MIDKRDIPSIECKIILRGPMSMTKVDGMSLILIDFYIQRSHNISITLRLRRQLSENITLSVVCLICTGVIS
jgi:hypothetical protein